MAQEVQRHPCERRFEEGSFAGLKWKKKLSRADTELVNAPSKIAGVRMQNDKLAKALPMPSLKVLTQISGRKSRPLTKSTSW